jgi:hypothetical protein
VLWFVNQQGLVESSITKDNGNTYTPINVPLAVDSYASDLNSGGDVTFFWLDSGGVGRGSLLHAGKYYRINYPKAIYTYAGGIKGPRTKKMYISSYGSSYHGAITNSSSLHEKRLA